MKAGIFAFVLAIFAATAAQAAEPVVLGTYGDWTAYHFSDDKGKVCFMSSKPVDTSCKGCKRGDISFFITHWQADKSKDVISVAIGYPFKSGSEATVEANGRSHKLFTDGEMAWAKDSATDGAIATDVQKGSKLVVKGTSQRGTNTTDTYSLKGSGDAYKAISTECGF